MSGGGQWRGAGAAGRNRGGAKALTISGTGVSNDGALRNISGSNTWAGAITDTSNAVRINADSGSTLTLSNTIDNGGLLLTLGGAGNTSAGTTQSAGQVG